MASIHDAAAEGNLEEVVRLVHEDPEVVNAVGDYGRTPFHLASYNGRVEVVSYLLDHGANINAKDDFGNTSLSEACRGGHLEVVELLGVKGGQSYHL